MNDTILLNTEMKSSLIIVELLKRKNGKINQSSNKFVF